MIEKKIKNFFNSISVSSPASCPCCEQCEQMYDEAEDMTEELEVMPDTAEEKNDAPKLCDYARFAAKTFLILASVLAVGKTVALLVDLVSGEDDED